MGISAGLGGGGLLPGLVLVKSQTVGSAVASVTVTNAFNATYDNYLVTMNTTGSSTHSIDIKLGSSVTGYYGVLIYSSASGSSPLMAGRNNSAQLNWVGGCSTAGGPSITSVQVLGPYLSSYTRFANGIYSDSLNYGTMQGEHLVASSYTDFVLTPNSGTLTGGTVRVYGYRN